MKKKKTVEIYYTHTHTTDRKYNSFYNSSRQKVDQKTGIIISNPLFTNKTNEYITYKN